MSRESKIMNSSRLPAQTLVSHYEAFGWELLSINGNQVTMSRETQNPVYPELVKHQAAYEAKEAEYLAITPPQKPVAPNPIEFGLCALLFFLAVIPLIIYCVVKYNQNQEYKAQLEAYNAAVAACQEKKRQILAEMEQIVLESRTIFFSRQS